MSISHHNALDGIEIGWRGLKADSAPEPMHPGQTAISNTMAAGRGLSSDPGGIGLRAYRCKFDHTGRAMNGGMPLASAPGAGLDIEAENLSTVCRDRPFREIASSSTTPAAGFITDSGDGGFAQRSNAAPFWGTTNFSLSPVNSAEPEI